MTDSVHALGRIKTKSVSPPTDDDLGRIVYHAFGACVWHDETEEGTIRELMDLKPDEDVSDVYRDTILWSVFRDGGLQVEFEDYPTAEDFIAVGKAVRERLNHG